MGTALGQPNPTACWGRSSTAGWGFSNFSTRQSNPEGLIKQRRGLTPEFLSPGVQDICILTAAAAAGSEATS